MENYKNKNGPFQDHTTKNLGSIFRICQINIEGISYAKCQYLSKILRENKIDVAVIQETHADSEQQLGARGRIPGYDVLGATYHKHYGCATYIRNNIENAHLVSAITDNNIETVTVVVENMSIVNVYKPPSIHWPPEVLQAMPHPAVYIGDFNSHHTLWKYNKNDENGEALTSWAEKNNMSLVFNAKDRGTFRSAAWNREYNPDLCFVTQNRNNQPPQTSRYVLGEFPHSQHRPVIVEVGIQIPIIRSIPRPRWNFKKANWQEFTQDLDKVVRWIPPVSENYDRFVKAVIATAKRKIPRGFRKEYIPGWSNDCEQLYQAYIETGDHTIADELLQNLDIKRREKWMEVTRTLDLKKSSREAWSLLRKLGGGSPVVHKTPLVTPNQIASRIVSLSRAPRDPQHTKEIKKSLTTMRLNLPVTSEISVEFTLDELKEAIKEIKIGKAPGFDGIHPEFLVHLGRRALQWLTKFFSHILQTGRIPKAFKKSKVIAVLKPNKPHDRTESYRPIALLSCCYKLLERLILNRIGPLVSEVIPMEQAGFTSSRSCSDQVLSLTTHIEAGFQKCLKTSVAFVDLTAAYDTVWKQGLLYKLIQVVPCRTTIQLIGNMLSDRKFNVILGSGISNEKKLNNGLPQGSVLAPLLFNLYTSDLPNTTAKKFTYADDIALAVQHKDFEQTEDILAEDLRNMGEYFHKWRLIPNLKKTEVSSFHLNNKMADRKLKVHFNNVLLQHQDFPKYLGVTLDRTLSFKKHLETISKKIQTRNNIIQKLSGSTWGASAHTLRCSMLSLVYSVAEYCAPVWINSPYTNKIDAQLNIAMRMVTGCIKSTPVFWLPVLSGVAPPYLRRKNALLKEFRKITSNPMLPIHEDLPDLEIKRLKSRNPPLSLAKDLDRTDFRTILEWTKSWSAQSPNPQLIRPGSEPEGFSLPRHLWKGLNRVRTGHGVCGDSLYKWGVLPSPQCDCGAPKQTLCHIVKDCPIRLYPNPFTDFFRAAPTAVEWLADLDINI
jgi:exonuclease III